MSALLVAEFSAAAASLSDRLLPDLYLLHSASAAARASQAHVNIAARLAIFAQAQDGNGNSL